MKGVKKHKKVVNNLLNCSKMNTDMHERYLNRSNMYYKMSKLFLNRNRHT